ncbi:MAG TPA: CsbD family protein [Labilithrix sp.]|nr:CsbD family protein [Labilithrix sp.]
MNWERVEGQWNQLKGELKSKWAKLTDDDLRNVGGKKERLIGKLQERYGVMKDEAERQVDEWIAKVGADRDRNPNRSH